MVHPVQVPTMDMYTATSAVTAPEQRTTTEETNTPILLSPSQVARKTDESENEAKREYAVLHPSPVAAEEDFGDLIVQGQTKAGERPNYSVNDPLGEISGFTNYNVREMRVLSSWVKRLGDVFRLYGFTGLQPRPIEFTANLIKKGGVTKQIYGLSRVQDGSLTRYALPFDRTVPLAIFLAQHEREMSFPYQRYDIGYAFRGEHASKGRYRAFIQADNDYVDRNLTPLADATTLVTTVEALKSLGAKNFKVLINHIVIAKAIIADAGVPKEKFEDALRAIDKLKPDNRDDVVKELCTNVPTLTKEQAEELLDRMNYRGPLDQFSFGKDMGPAVNAALKDLLEMESIATQMGLEKGTVVFALNLTRGLDYYTGVVFETFIQGKEKYGSIASGGRYDKLVDGFSERETGLQGVGISIGVTRFFDIAKAEGLVDLSKQTEAQVFVGYRIKEEGCFEKAIAVATALRKKGIAVELYASSKVKVGKELDLANKKGIPFAAIVMNKNEVVVRNMGSSKQVSFVNDNSVEEHVAAYLETCKNQGAFDTFKPVVTEDESKDGT